MLSMTMCKLLNNLSASAFSRFRSCRLDTERGLATLQTQRVHNFQAKSKCRRVSHRKGIYQHPRCQIGFSMAHRLLFNIVHISIGRRILSQDGGTGSLFQELPNFVFPPNSNSQEVCGSVVAFCEPLFETLVNSQLSSSIIRSYTSCNELFKMDHQADVANFRTFFPSI